MKKLKRPAAILLLSSLIFAQDKAISSVDFDASHGTNDYCQALEALAKPTVTPEHEANEADKTAEHAFDPTLPKALEHKNLEDLFKLLETDDTDVEALEESVGPALTEDESKMAEYFHELAIEHPVLFGIVHERALSRVYNDVFLKDKKTSLSVEEFVKNPKYRTETLMMDLSKKILKRIKNRLQALKIKGDETVFNTLAPHLQVERINTLKREAEYYYMSENEFEDASRVAETITANSEKEKYALMLIKSNITNFIEIAMAERNEVGNLRQKDKDADEKGEPNKISNKKIAIGTGAGTVVLAGVGFLAHHIFGVPGVADVLVASVPAVGAAAVKAKQWYKRNKTDKLEQKHQYNLSSFREQLVDEDGRYRPREKVSASEQVASRKEIAQAKEKAVKVTPSFLKQLTPPKINPASLESCMKYGEEFDVMIPSLRRESQKIYEDTLSDMAWMKFASINNMIVKEIKNKGFASISEVEDALIAPLKEQTLFLAQYFDKLTRLDAKVMLTQAKLNEFTESAEQQNASFSQFSNDVAERVEFLRTSQMTLPMTTARIATLRTVIKAKIDTINKFLNLINNVNGSRYDKDDLKHFEFLNSAFIASSEEKQIFN